MGIGIFLELQNTIKLHTHHYQWVRWVHMPCLWKHVLQETLLIPTSGILKTCIIKSYVRMRSTALSLLSQFSFSSVQFSHSVLSDSLRPHESQHARPPCPSPLPEFTQTHVHQVGDAIQPSHPLSSPSPHATNPSQHQGLFQ